MIELLCSMFIKNKDDIMNVDVRKAYGTLTGSVGIINNVFLFLIKFVAGTITGAISIVADAFNNLSDAGSSIISLIGFRMAGKPADNDHPFGHGRIEYVSGLLIAIIILLMGIELFKASVEKIINPERVEFSVISVVILLVSIGIKLWMTSYNRHLGKKLDASAMLATAADSLNDCIATTVVLISLVVSKFFDVNIDGYAGCLVSVFVLWSGFQTAKDTLQPLLGTPPSLDLIEKIEGYVLSQGGINGVHDVIVHDYGPGRLVISLHAEVSNNLDIMTSHDIIDRAENYVKQKMGCEITIHMDPISTDDVKTNQLKLYVKDIVKSVDETMDIHDFRIGECEGREIVIFDVSAPFTLELTDEEIRYDIVKIFKNKYNDYRISIENVDRVSV